MNGRSLVPEFDTMGVPPEGGSIWPNARKPDYRIDPETSCWEWLKSKHHGYGLAREHGRAARAYYKLAYGEIPPDHDIHHHCGNKGCVNPAHLKPVPSMPHRIKHRHSYRALDLETVQAIRTRLLDPVPVPQVAEEFGVALTTVRHIVSGDRYDLPGRAPVIRDCAFCGKPIDPMRSRKARYCNPLCHSRFHSAKHWNTTPSRWRTA